MPEISDSEWFKIDGIAESLHDRIKAEIEKLLQSQLRVLGADQADVQKKIYPNDPLALCTYEYKGQKILGVRISDNRMCIQFDIPNIETQKEVFNALQR